MGAEGYFKIVSARANPKPIKTAKVYFLGKRFIKRNFIPSSKKATKKNKPKRLVMWKEGNNLKNK